MSEQGHPRHKLEEATSYEGQEATEKSKKSLAGEGTKESSEGLFAGQARTQKASTRGQ